MLRSIRRKKKTSARSDVQSIQDSSISSRDIVRRAVNLVPQLQDSSKDFSPQGSTQDYLVTTLKSIKKINRDFINALLVIRIQDSSQDSFQVSYQDSSQMDPAYYVKDCAVKIKLEEINCEIWDLYIMTLLLTNKSNQGSTNLGMSAMKRKDLRQKILLLTLTSFALGYPRLWSYQRWHFSEALSLYHNPILILSL